MPKTRDIGIDIDDFFTTYEPDMRTYNTISSFKKNIISDLENTELVENFENKIDSVQTRLVERLYDAFNNKIIGGRIKSGKSYNRNKINKKNKTKRKINK